MRKSLRIFLWAFPLFLSLLFSAPLPLTTTGLMETFSHFHQVHKPTPGDLTYQKQAMRKAHPSSSSRFTSYDGSGNTWSGYVAIHQPSGFQGIEAKWNAPCTSGIRDSNHRYGSWVGIGGYLPSNSPEPLEQAGILLQNDGTYRLFWEYISSTEPPFIDGTDVIYCGDHISAWVYLGSTFCSNGGFYAHVEDDTRGSHLGSTCLTKGSYGIESADWIDERPLTTSCYAPTQLADFHYTQWSNVLARSSGSSNWYNPNSYPNDQILMWDQGTSSYIAYPDGLSVNSDNTFTDRWYGYGTYCDVG